MTTPIRILVADDHPVVRDGLIAILSTQPDFIIVGQAATGTDVIRQVASLAPDVVLLDLEMPEMNGVQVLRQLRAEYPLAHALIFTAFDTDELIVQAVQAGAQGYLLKGAPRDEIFRAIRLISAGGSLLGPVVASKLIHHVQSQELLETQRLTGREMQVLHLLAQGKSNKEIAAALSITQRTVKFHVSSIMGKLGANNRTEAVTVAAQHGLIKLAD